MRKYQLYVSPKLFVVNLDHRILKYGLTTSKSSLLIMTIYATYTIQLSTKKVQTLYESKIVDVSFDHRILKYDLTTSESSFPITTIYVIYSIQLSMEKVQILYESKIVDLIFRSSNYHLSRDLSNSIWYKERTNFL